MSGEPSLVRLATQWLLAVAVAISATAFILAIAGIQMTSEDTGRRIQRRAAAALTDIDAILPSVEVQLAETEAPTGGDTVLVPGFPIPVLLTREEAATLRGAELQRRLLDESGKRLYEDGMSAWAKGDPAGHQEIDRVSSSAAVYRSLNLVRDSTYTYLVILAALLGVLTFILGLVLLLTIRTGFMRLLAVGVLLLAASMPALAAAVALRFAFKTAQTDGDSFVEAMLQLGVDTMWLPIRMYLALSMVGFATIGVASLGLWLDSRPPSRTISPAN